MTREVLIVPTGTANLASVRAGIGRAGGHCVECRDPERIAAADRVVLPGVGAMAAARRRLDTDGLVAALTARIEAGRPTLAVCLGLQLLCASSEESPGVPGLGVLDVPVTRFPDDVITPQMGWNQVAPQQECSYLKPGYAYFANSFRLERAPEGWNAAWAEHGGRFVAALESGDVLACQFHPELSGAWGADLLRRWVAGRQEGNSSC